MSKILITKEQLIEVKGGWTSYYNANGNVCKARNGAIEVADADKSARSPGPRAKAEKPAKTPTVKAEGENEEVHNSRLRRVGNSKYDCTHYEKTKSSSGNKTLDSGDELAVELRGMELPAVYKRAAKELGESLASLEQRYKALNPGMQRMNLGNRIRAALKKRAATVADSAK